MYQSTYAFEYTTRTKRHYWINLKDNKDMIKMIFLALNLEVIEGKDFSCFPPSIFFKLLSISMTNPNTY